MGVRTQAGACVCMLVFVGMHIEQFAKCTASLLTQLAHADTHLAMCHTYLPTCLHCMQTINSHMCNTKSNTQLKKTTYRARVWV